MNDVIGMLTPLKGKALEDKYATYEGAISVLGMNKRNAGLYVALLEINGELQGAERDSLQGLTGVDAVAARNQIRILEMQAEDFREDLLEIETQQELDSN
jgi:hypothetical protein